MIRVRLIAEFNGSDRSEWQDVWKDVSLPMAPFVGMELNLIDFDEVTTIGIIQWAESENMLMASLLIGMRNASVLFTAMAEVLDAGWNCDTNETPLFGNACQQTTK